MILPAAWPQSLDFFGTPLVIEPSAGQLSSDAGLLPVRQFDQRVGLTRAFAEALDDPRDPDLTEHTFREMVRARVYGILAGYFDQNDHDTLRADPVFKLLADRSPEDDDLASQPTLSRFENAISIKSRKRLRDLFLYRFIASFDSPPRHLTFDPDAVMCHRSGRVRSRYFSVGPAEPVTAATWSRTRSRGPEPTRAAWASEALIKYSDHMAHTPGVEPFRLWNPRGGPLPPGNRGFRGKRGKAPAPPEEAPA
jgi:hypothetical protein